MAGYLAGKSYRALESNLGLAANIMLGLTVGVVLVFWLCIIFASFGLFAPRNITAIVAMLLLYGRERIEQRNGEGQTHEGGRW